MKVVSAKLPKYALRLRAIAFPFLRDWHSPVLSDGWMLQTITLDENCQLFFFRIDTTFPGSVVLPLPGHAPALRWTYLAASMDVPLLAPYNETSTTSEKNAECRSS